tara:strand:+ start:313 stop:780 length:468 start_codon:yes stop_codon:yes gene_type:complete
MDTITDKFEDSVKDGNEEPVIETITEMEDIEDNDIILNIKGMNLLKDELNKISFDEQGEYTEDIINDTRILKNLKNAFKLVRSEDSKIFYEMKNCINYFEMKLKVKTKKTFENSIPCIFKNKKYEIIGLCINKNLIIKNDNEYVEIYADNITLKV